LPTGETYAYIACLYAL